MNTPWLRLYSETLDDMKIARVVKQTGFQGIVILGAWTGLLMLAGRSPIRGRLLLAINMPLTIEEMADKIGIEPENLSHIIESFISVGMLARDGDALFMPNWNKRQFSSDNSTERVQDWRSRQKEVVDAPNGTANGDDNEMLQEHCSNVSVTPSESDTDTDTESEQIQSVAAAPPMPTPARSKHQRKIKEPKAPPPPAVQVYRSVTNLFPVKALWPTLAETVGEDGAGLDRWRATVLAWLGCGWNPRNVAGMLDFYQRGKIPSTGNSGGDGNRPQGAAASRQALASWLQSHGEPVEAL